MKQRILDCTLRDGGLVNRFRFSDEFVRALYKANLEAGIDYMEFGYKSSEDQFDRESFGKWKFCREEDIRDIVGDHHTPMKISVMADVGRTDYRKDIIDRKDSVIDMIRIATYGNTIDEALEMTEYCAEKGYETSVNIMAISNNTREELSDILDKLGRSPADAIYLVDSYGSFYPEQIRSLAAFYVEKTAGTGKQIGIHAHNNQQLAFANTIEAVNSGISLIDVTVNGMGRGAGNCSTEQLLGYFREREEELPILEFIEKYMLPLKKDGVVWGYDIPYLLTGQGRRHPSSAIQFMQEKKTAYSKLYYSLQMGMKA
ncbi:MAG: aldolase catalytic domain-containing protein [Eubacteriales bacterium]|nr:aldolase catalytic domain-containing protein [Eubacteriales bacterium]